jgi:phosphocarrier protein
LIEKEIRVINSLGLHARPAAQLVKTVSRFKSEIFITRDDLTVNAKSIMGVMMLAAELGAVLKFRVDGVDEREAMEAIENVFHSKFGEN